jgi:Domain of unknown function (DUF5667)
VFSVTANFRDRQRAERFAELLEQAASGSGAEAGTPGGRDGEYEPMLRTATALTALSERSAVEVDPEFKARLRTRLLAQAQLATMQDAVPVPRAAGVEERLRAPGQHRAPASRRRRRGLWLGVAAAAAIVVSAGSVSYASGSAVPGDPLYGVKRQKESARLTLAGSDTEKGQLYLQFARTRLDELRQMGHRSPADLGKVLADMDDETTSGVRLLTSTAVDKRSLRPLSTVSGFADSQRKQLGALIDELPPGARDRVLDSLVPDERVLARAAALAAQMPCGAAADRVDDLGPLPGPCGTTRKPAGGTPGHTKHPTGGGNPTTVPTTPVPTLPGSDPAPGTSASPAPGGSTPSPDSGLGAVVDPLQKLVNGAVGGLTSTSTPHP